MRHTLPSRAVWISAKPVLDPKPAHHVRFQSKPGGGVCPRTQTTSRGTHRLLVGDLSFSRACLMVACATRSRQGLFGSALAGGAEADRSAWGFFCSFSLFQFLPQPSLPGAPCCDLPLNQPITSASIQNHTAESVWKHNSLCEAPQHRKVRVGTRTHTAFPLFKCSFFRARNLKPLFFWLSRSAGAQLPLASPAFPPFSVRLM